MRELIGRFLNKLEMQSSDLMKKEVVGANHLTLTIACFDTAFTRPDGTQYEKADDDTDLKQVCDEGHWYYER